MVWFQELPTDGFSPGPGFASRGVEKTKKLLDFGDDLFSCAMRWWGSKNYQLMGFPPVLGSASRNVENQKIVGFGVPPGKGFFFFFYVGWQR